MKDNIIIIYSWNFIIIIEKNIIKSKIIINSNIIIIIYYYNISLKLYNIQEIDEYSIYIIQFLKNILKNKSYLLKLMLFYDINYRFSKYIKIETRINCF